MENITIKELVKDIDLTDTTILRLKGHRNISHDNRLKNPLLSDQVWVLTLEDLKIFIIYSLKFKDYKKRNIEKWVRDTKDYLKKNNLDRSFKLIVLENKNLKINKDKLINNPTIEVCLEILKQIYPIPTEKKNTYSPKDIFNLKIEESSNIIENTKEENISNCDYSNVLDFIFNKYTKKETGYFPLQHPTGNGKTFFLEKFLIENIKNDFENLSHDRIIVITNSKVNLNEIYRNISSKIRDKEKIEKYVLKLESINDIFNDINFLNETISELQKDLEFYKAFPPNFINNFRIKLKNSIMYIEKDLNPEMSDKIKEFIPRLKKEMFNYFSNILAKKDLKNVILPKFLYKMYPMIDEKNLRKKIYIMTTDKFLYGYVGMTETAYFYEKEKSLIFIDEIDSAKQNFLKFIKAQRTLYADNIINVFNDRFNSFSSSGNNQLLNLMKRLDEVGRTKIEKENLFSKEELIKINNQKNKLFKIINDFAKEGKRLRKKYLTMKKYYELENPQKIDLWEDEFNYFQNNGVRYYINVNKKNCLITTDKSKETLSLNDLIRELFNFCYGYFYYVLVNISNYHKLFFGDEEVEKEIISHFFFNEDLQNQIMNEYKNFFMKRLNRRGKKQYDVTEEDKIVNMKYSYFQIKEANPDYPFNEKVLLGSQFMYTTPEIMLYKMCQENLVFGISATANIETCVGNFDLRFLKINLKDKYFSLTTFEKEKLKNSLERINRFEKDITRILNIFGKMGNREIGFKNVEELEKNDKTTYRKIKTILNILSDKIDGEEKQKENQKMYFEYSCMVFLNFLLEKNSKSLLFISNRLTQISILKKALSEMKEILKIKSEDVSFRELNSKEIDENFENKDTVETELMKDLSDSTKKTIIYTTYQSAGTGVNFKCLAKNFNKKNLVGLDEKIQKEIKFPLDFKDIDEIAIENKTHLINFDEERNKVEMIYYSSLLLDNNALSKEHRSFLLKGDTINFTGAYKKKYDYVENCMGKIIQGIGRCSRTKLRNEKRNIYMDEDSFNVAKRFEKRNRLFIEDINFILEEAKKIALQERDATSFEKELVLRNYNIERTFEKEYLEKINEYNNILKFSKNDILREETYDEFLELVKSYNEFRRFILKNPTRSASTIKNKAYFSIGENISAYNILRYDDNSIKRIDFNSLENNVSYEECRLEDIFNIPLLNKFCIDNIGKFEANEEIIFPYIYQAIFKGILGEVIIKEIFSMYKIILKNEDFMIRKGIFEKFDDVTENGIWIDYKNYNLDKIDSREFFNAVIENSVLRKEALINSRNKLFIINLISGKRRSKSMACYKVSEILKNKKQVCPYEESEVIIINGVLKYKNDGKTLEINHILMRKLQKLLGGNNE